MTHQDIYEMFPLLNELSDPKLKENCAKAWVTCFEEGGYDLEGANKIPFVLAEMEGCPLTLVDHTNCVTKTALLLYNDLNESYGRWIKIDRDLVIAGAIMHDVGKVIEYEKVEGGRYFGHDYSERGKLMRHPLYGGIVCSRCGLPDSVVHATATHSFEGENSYMSPESFIVRRADLIGFAYLGFAFKRHQPEFK